MLKIIRWFFGFVIFTAKGKFLERFLNLTAREKINLWNVKKKNKVFYACVMASDYKKFKLIAKKSKTKPHIIKKCGLPFILKKLKPRFGIIIGIICFFSVIYIMSSFIWSINIIGNEKIKTEEILNVVSELGLSSGSFKKKLNTSTIEQNAMIKLPEIAWMSININGCLATVSLQERITPPPIVEKNEPCNIKAIKDGQILRTEVYKGSIVIKNGDAVTKGQLLVSGVVENSLGNNTLEHANAKIIANTKNEICEKIPFEQTIHQKTGTEVNRYSVKIFGMHLPLSLLPNPGNGFERNLSKNQINSKKIKLPIELFKENFTEFCDKQITLTIDEAKKMAKEKIAQREQDEFKNIKILNSQKNESYNNNAYIINIVYNCEENIAFEEAINID